MLPVSDRTRDLGTENAFVVLKEALDRIASGKDIKNFCIGQPDFVTPDNIRLAAMHALILGKTGYTGNARHCFVGAVDTVSGPVFTAVLGARSRTSLWRATSMLAEVGVHPELADGLEAFSSGKGGGRAVAVARKAKPVAAEMHGGDVIDDIQRSRLQGLF